MTSSKLVDMPSCTSRKERRREKRALKKRNQTEAVDTTVPTPKRKESSISTHQRRPKKKSRATTLSESEPLNNNGASQVYRERMDPGIAAALKRDEEEIAELAAKLGLSKPKDKKKLNKEFEVQEGYGADFGDFLDSLDVLVDNVRNNDFTDASDYQPVLGGPDSDSGESEESEETVPMKEPAESNTDGTLDETEFSGGNFVGGDSESLDGSDSSMEGAESEDETPDHEHLLTYQPDEGENIYGQKTDTKLGDSTPSKYVPPHMRKNESGSNDAHKLEEMRTIRRLLNASLNRLSIDTLLSVSQSLTALYVTHSTSDVNVAIADNLHTACISKAQLMTGLIPVYVASLVCVHILKGDSAQLAEHIIEHYVQELLTGLETARNEMADLSTVNKEICNVTLVICYLYTFGVVHCSLMLDLIRNMIESFKEVDVELLLIILSHSGRVLRSDDPTALKDIVLLVQKQYVDVKKSANECSRMEYMVTAVMDLKNNKKRKQDASFEERTSRIRKVLGQVKSEVAVTKGGSKSADGCLRIGLKDIIDIESKGRWWKVGASWSGNLYGERKAGNNSNDMTDEQAKMPKSEQEDKLLRLASKYRMNSDTRRSSFCIVMSSTDCEECFEKLVRASLLSNKNERDSCRVILECCGNEKSYNKYYSHLAARVCGYRTACKFTFQLAFFDVFKQIDTMSLRKTANLSNFLFDLIANHRVLKLNVIKAIDLSSPEDLGENSMIFSTLLLTSILDKCSDPAEVRQFFEDSISRRKAQISDEIEASVDELGQTDEGETLMASLTVFFVQVLKASPKYKKGSRFRSNLKAAIKACDTEDFF